MHIQKDGSVILTDTFVAQPNLSLEAFRSTTEVSLWDNLTPEDASYGTYKRDFHKSDGIKFTAWLMFNWSVLGSVYLSYFLPNEHEKRIRIVEGWENDVKRKQLHSEILLAELGDPPYEYAWGYVLNDVNELDMTSTIKILYRSNYSNDSSLKVKYSPPDLFGKTRYSEN